MPRSILPGRSTLLVPSRTEFDLDTRLIQAESDILQNASDITALQDFVNNVGEIRVERGTYGGSGSDPQTVNLGLAAYMVFVSGTNTDGDMWAFIFRDSLGFRLVDDAVWDGSTMIQNQLINLNSPYTSFQVTGTGSSGLNASGITYEYIALG